MMAVDQGIIAAGFQNLEVLFVVRLLRVTRLFKVLGICKPLHRMMLAFNRGMCEVGWLIILIIGILYIFAIATTMLYGHEDPEGEFAPFFLPKR